MAKKGTATSDEQIIAALLHSGTIKEAAAAVNMSERAIYDRMNNSEFKALYKAARADLVRGAVADINSHIQEAITTVADIMTNKENNPAIRLQAAQTILNTAGKFTARLIADESLLDNQLMCNRLHME